MRLTGNLLYTVVQKIFRLLGRVPSALAETCSAVLGSLFYALARKHRKIAIDNLSMAFGEVKSPDEIVAIARQVFINLVRIVFEYSRAWQWDDRQLAQQISIRGLEEIRRANAKGKGVILLGAHFGNWELLPMVVHMAGVTMGIVYRAMDSPVLDMLFMEIRSRHGNILIPNQRGAMRRLYKTLKRGNAVGLLMDQGVDFDDGFFADFFNQRAATATGPAILALKSQAPVVPLFIIRRSRGFQAVFGPELPLIQTGDRTKDIEENTQLYNHVIEAYVRRFPDQWFWVHQRWINLPFCPWPRTNPRVSNRY